MKNILIYIFIIFLLSCSSTKQKEKLIGNWYSSINDDFGFMEFQFYNDSLIIYHNLGKVSADWKVIKDKIHLNRMTGFTSKQQITYSYKIDKSKEFLQLKILSDSIIEFPELRKAKNRFDFFKKTIDLEIELPESTTKIKNISHFNRTSFEIYAGYKNGKLVVKTDKSSGLDNLESEFKDFLKTVREEFKPFIKFNLVADKNISKFQMDSIIKRIRKTFVTPIYRTYKNDTIDYKNNINWCGKIEKN